MKKLLSLILVALMVMPLGMLGATGISADAGTVLYVKEGGTGDGSSAENALPSIFAANDIAATKSEDVTIKFVGTVTVDGNDAEKFVSHRHAEVAHANTITWTGADADAKLVFATSTSQAKYYMLGGDLKVENINIEISGTKVLVLLTHLHNVEFGEGVTVVNPTKSTETISIYGEVKETYMNSPFYDEATGTHNTDTTITIKSGSFKQVVGYMGNASTNLTEAKIGKTIKLNGDVNINVSGADTYIYQIYPVCNSYNTVTNCTITLDGGIIGRFVGACDRIYNPEKPTTGMLAYGASGTTGTYTLYLTENFDLDAQIYLKGDDAKEFYLSLCGTTANRQFNGSAEDDALLGTQILKIDKAIYEAAIAETVKINFATFDTVQMVENVVEPPVDTEPEETEPAETTPAETEPAETEPAETTPAETEPAETTPAETEPAETTPAETEPSVDTEEPGNTPTGDSTLLVTVIGAIAVASLGVVIVLKKRENA